MKNKKTKILIISALLAILALGFFVLDTKEIKAAPDLTCPIENPATGEGCPQEPEETQYCGGRCRLVTEIDGIRDDCTGGQEFKCNPCACVCPGGLPFCDSQCLTQQEVDDVENFCLQQGREVEDYCGPVCGDCLPGSKEKNGQCISPYVLFVPDSAQENATEDPSMYINVTGSGDLMQFEKNNTPYFTVNNSGHFMLGANDMALGENDNLIYGVINTPEDDFTNPPNLLRFQNSSGTDRFYVDYLGNTGIGGDLTIFNEAGSYTFSINEDGDLVVVDESTGDTIMNITEGGGGLWSDEDGWIWPNEAGDFGDADGGLRIEDDGTIKSDGSVIVSGTNGNEDGLSIWADENSSGIDSQTTDFYLDSEGNIGLRLNKDNPVDPLDPKKFTLNNGANITIFSVDELGNLSLNNAAGDNIFNINQAGDVFIEGDTTMEGDLTITNEAGETVFNVNQEGDTHIYGETIMEENLEVLGDTYIHGHTTIDDGVTINKNGETVFEITEEGDTHILKDLTVEGDVEGDSFTVNGETINDWEELNNYVTLGLWTEVDELWDPDYIYPEQTVGNFGEGDGGLKINNYGDIYMDGYLFLSRNTDGDPGDGMFMGALWGTGDDKIASHAPDNFYIDGDGDVQIRVDANNEEIINEFRINNGANTTIFSVDELGNLSLNNAAGDNIFNITEEGDVTMEDVTINNLDIEGCFGPTWAGPSDGNVGPNQGGYVNANGLCGEYGEGAHVCSWEEVLRTISCDIDALPDSGKFWVNGGPQGNDCAGWTSADATGALWDFDANPTADQGGIGYTTYCNRSSIPFACCK